MEITFAFADSAYHSRPYNQSHTLVFWERICFLIIFCTGVSFILDGND